MRLFIARPDNHHRPAWKTIEYKHAITRLGQGLHQHGKLCEAGMHRTLKVLRGFSNIIQQYNIPTENTHIVATAAMREAANGITYRDFIKREIGLNVQIIGGDIEAQTALAGSLSVLNAPTQEDMLLFDIGGGSTEFTRSKDGEIIDAMSRKLGVVRLVEAHLQSDPPSDHDYQAMLHTAQQHLDQVEFFWSNEKAPKYLVGTAGTVTTLAAIQMNLIPYDAAQVNNYSMSKEVFLKLKTRLLTLNHEQRQKIATLEQGRADLIIAGIAIIESIMNRWHYDQLVTVDAGLLEGAWLGGVQSALSEVT